MRLAVFWKALEKELTPAKVTGALQSLTSDGGFTVAVHDGSVPSSGYMVGLVGHEEKMAPGSVSATVIEDYVGRHEDALTPADHFLGGWIDKVEGLAYLDVAEHVPTLSTAVDTGRGRGQIAIFHLDRSKDVYLQEPKPDKMHLFDFTDEHGGIWIEKAGKAGGDRIRFFIGVDPADIDGDGIADWIEMLIKGTLEGGLSEEEAGEPKKKKRNWHVAGHEPLDNSEDIANLEDEIIELLKPILPLITDEVMLDNLKESPFQTVDFYYDEIERLAGSEVVAKLRKAWDWMIELLEEQRSFDDLEPDPDRDEDSMEDLRYRLQGR